MINKEEKFKEITKAVIGTYQEEMHLFLASAKAGELTDADVIMMIMNITMSVSTNIYYSLKNILPNAPMDFDYMKVTMMNNLIKQFDAIKDYNPKDKMTVLTTEQVKEIIEKGFIEITYADGTKQKVTEKDLIVDKKTAEDLAKSVKEKAANDLHMPEKKLILPPGVKR